MKIDLRRCATGVINLRHDLRRRESAMRLCERLELPYQVVDAIRCAPGDVGCGLTHLRLLRAAAGSLPLLALEDDVLETEAFTPVLTVPDDTDAVWLGGSDFGAVGIAGYIGYIHMQLLEEAEHDLLRPHNLLSTHAILYITERFRRAAIEAITAAVVEGRPPNSGLASIQSDFSVYAAREPRFYQAAHLQPRGRQLIEDWTRIRLEPTAVGKTCLFEAPGGVRKAIAVRTPRGLDWAWADEEAADAH